VKKSAIPNEQKTWWGPSSILTSWLEEKSVPLPAIEPRSQVTWWLGYPGSCGPIFTAAVYSTVQYSTILLWCRVPDVCMSCRTAHFQWHVRDSMNCTQTWFGSQQKANTMCKTHIKSWINFVRIDKTILTGSKPVFWWKKKLLPFLLLIFGLISWNSCWPQVNVYFWSCSSYLHKIETRNSDKILI
jgi:hypothetical protein